MHGIIEKYDDERGFGWVRGEENGAIVKRFFHISTTRGTPVVGAHVTYTPVESQKGRSTRDVVVIDGGK